MLAKAIDQPIGLSATHNCCALHAKHREIMSAGPVPGKERGRRCDKLQFLRGAMKGFAQPLKLCREIADKIVRIAEASVRKPVANVTVNQCVLMPA
ncbi:hypothetical protein ABIF97_004063 [Bradyrhizobium japonicum]